MSDLDEFFSEFASSEWRVLPVVIQKAIWASSFSVLCKDPPLYNKERLGLIILGSITVIFSFCAYLVQSHNKSTSYYLAIHRSGMMKGVWVGSGYIYVYSNQNR